MVTLLPGSVSIATRCLGFDADTCISAAQAQSFYAAGYRFCARYLARTALPQPPVHGGSNLSVAEAQDLLRAKLALVLVQHADDALVPDASTGALAGEAAAKNAQGLGFPSGMTLWCDLEWASRPSLPAADAVTDYLNAWAAAVKSGGFVPGLYVGPNQPLSGEQLHQLPGFAHYWKSASAVPWVAMRGFQMVQGLPVTVQNVEVDPDLIVLDAFGEGFTWLSPHP
jgi:hypothetical protein